jgi:hypothetical protein
VHDKKLWNLVRIIVLATIKEHILGKPIGAAEARRTNVMNVRGEQ